MINNTELLYNEENEYVGFVGLVKVRNSDVYIDTRTGKGYDKVISMLTDMVGFLASRFNLEGFTIEDNKQHIVLRILEGIPKFNPNKDVKLSTFLQIRISRLLINEIRDANRFCRNATSLNIKTYNYRCSCGNTITANKNDKIEFCNSCGLPIEKSKRYWIRKNTVSLDSLSDGYLGASIQSSTETSKKINEIDFLSCIKNESSLVQKIVCLLYFDGESIKSIAEKLSMTPTTVYNKLKKLRENKRLKELMRGENVCFG